MGTAYDTSVVRPETYRTVWIALYMAGTLNASNLVCVMFAERHGVLDSSKDSAETEGCLVSVYEKSDQQNDEHRLGEEN